MVALVRPALQPATCGQCGGASGLAEAGGPSGGSHCGSQYQLCSSWLISRLGVNVWCEQRYARFKTCASVLYLMRTMRPMHHFDHRTRREATVVARTYLLEHYCLHPLYGRADLVFVRSPRRRSADGRPLLLSALVTPALGTGADPFLVSCESWAFWGTMKSAARLRSMMPISSDT